MKKFQEFINEGIWALTEDLQHYSNFIKEIKELKDKYYNTIGDDELFDELDNAISRARDLRDMAIQETAKKYNL